MPRLFTTGVRGGPILGSLAARDNVISSIEEDGDVTITPNGTGRTYITSTLAVSTQNEIRWEDADSTNYVALKSPETVNANVTYTLPGEGVTENYFIKTDADGNLSWALPEIPLTNDTTATTTHYLLFIDSTTGPVNGVKISDTKINFQPSTGTLDVDILKTPSLQDSSGRRLVLKDSNGTVLWGN